MKPTICIACGEPIERTDGRHLCDSCSGSSQLLLRLAMIRKDVTALRADVLRTDRQPKSAHAFGTVLQGLAEVRAFWDEESK
jgi:hypothetical protein